MEATLSLNRLSKVLVDWDKVKLLDNWEKEAGATLFMNLFEKCPDAKPLFGFSMKTDPRSKALLKSQRFAKHSKFLIQMIDKVVLMLASESETSDDESGRAVILTDILVKLGKKHVAYGVKPEWFPFMTESLIAMLEEVIGSSNSDAWRDIFDFLCFHMDYGHKAIDKDTAASKNKAACIQVWKELAKVPDYKKKGGVLLFQHLFEMCPEVKVLFGFPADVDPKSETLLKSARFSLHSQFLLSMVEKTIQLLGEDNQTMADNLHVLGKKHVSFGVTPEMLPSMTDALMAMLKEMLGDNFTSDQQDSFENVMSLMIADMVKGHRSVDKTLSTNNRDIVEASWAKFTKVDGYDTKGSLLLFQKLFELCPESKMLFGFPEDTDPNSEALLKNDLFKKHASFLLSMIGKMVGMLGHEDEVLEKDLVEVGKKHVTYGVQANMFPKMTAALIATMKELQGGEFTEEEERAWDDILSLFISDMIKGQRLLDLGLAASNKTVTNRNWEALKAISDYDEVGGVEIFSNLFKVCPEAKPFFGFKEDYPDDEVRRSKRILVHGSFIVEMVERALDKIGEDDFEIETMLQELGKKHSQYNVQPEHMPFMAQSIVIMLKSLLNEEHFSEEDEKAWNSVLAALVANITRAQREIAMKKLSEELVL